MLTQVTFCSSIKSHNFQKSLIILSILTFDCQKLFLKYYCQQNWHQKLPPSTLLAGSFILPNLLHSFLSVQGLSQTSHFQTIREWSSWSWESIGNSSLLSSVSPRTVHPACQYQIRGTVSPLGPSKRLEILAMQWGILGLAGCSMTVSPTEITRPESSSSVFFLYKPPAPWPSYHSCPSGCHIFNWTETL